MSIQFEENLNWNGKSNAQSNEDSRKKAQETAPLILQKIEEEYSPVARFFNSIKEYFGEEQNPSFWLYGKYMVNRDVFENGTGDDFEKESAQKNTVNPTTEIKSKPIEEVEILKVDKKAQDEYVLTHNFEKVETAEEFNGIWRGFDGDDSLEEDADALNELNLKHLVRTDEVAQSIYQAEFRDLASIAESTELEDENVCLTYKEWDYSKKRYKPDYCKVYLKKNKRRRSKLFKKMPFRKLKNAG